jgi:hypothetical protein
MGLRPQLNVVCGRCGKPRGLRHDCISNSSRKATFKPEFSFGKCPKCRKPYGNPLTHVCAPKSDFKKRRSLFEKQEKAKARAAARKKRQAEKHDYQACGDEDCKRSLCVAYKAGRSTGDEEGFERGFATGYDAGFQDGIDACPRSHGTA